MNDITEYNTTELTNIEGLEAPFIQALESVDDIVLKKYLLNLDQYEVVPMDSSGITIDKKQDIRLFKIDEMVYEKDGFSTDKFATLFSTFSNKQESIFLLIDSNGIDINLYFGINTNGNDISVATIKKAFENTLKSQFPGIKTSNVDVYQADDLSNKINEYQHISSYSGIAFDRVEDTKENKEFVQGLDRFLMSMEGKSYTGIILGSPVQSNDLEIMGKQLESIYTNLSAYKTSQIGYTLNKSENSGTSTTKGTSKSFNISNTTGTSSSESKSTTTGTTNGSKGGVVLSTLGGVGAVAAATALAASGGLLTPVLLGAGAGAGVSSIVGKLMSTKQTTKNETLSSTESINRSETVGKNYGENYSESETIGYTTGDSQSLTLTKENKAIENILENVDEQLTRLKTFDNTGAFGCAAYFFSDSSYEAEFAASSYRALVSGEKTMTESSATNIWEQSNPATNEVKKYLSLFTHPRFKYNKLQGLIVEPINLTPASIVSGRELAIHMGLPRKSVANFPVVEHALFGTSILKYNSDDQYRETIPLGNIFHLGEQKKQPVFLDLESLSMHTFITGATGSGKSNTTYLILEKLLNRNVNFLVIEPAKGEYKHMFGNRSDVSVYGTNNEHSDMLKINPFYFPKGIHVLEHVDRLIEIFNVCWPMYAAMPAILKQAVLNSYVSVGWDLTTSKYLGDTMTYPNFLDLEQQLEIVINSSSYSADSKGDYTGALVTRVHSLTTGLNQFIFSNDDLSDQELFDENVIADLSRVGSSETKSLIMGLLVMRLNEYRVCQAQELGRMNQSLKHITVLEEAHNLLKRTSQEQSSEGANLAGKSVEMLSNSIAEMRTYGEGFIIVDQSPSSVDLSAIKNTNTKIIMRTPEYSDRELVGKAVGLSEEQIEEIIKLPKGVGVIFQNDWVEAILCSISKSRSEEQMYQYEPKEIMSEQLAKSIILSFLFNHEIKKSVDIEELKKAMLAFRTTSKINQKLNNLVIEYEDNGYIELWNIENYGDLSEYINSLSGISRAECVDIINKAEDEVTVIRCMEKLVDRKLLGVDNSLNKAVLEAIIRFQAEDNLVFHRIYQLIREGDAKVL